MDAADARLLDLEIPDRHFVVVTGPRGAGTSRLVRAIAGLEKLSSGEIRLGDKRIDELPPKQRDVAMVFANDSLYPGMTMRENIAFGLKRRRFGKSEITKRVNDAADALGIESHLGKKPHECPLPVRQRVAMARGAATRPQIFLYDDALARLETGDRAELRNEIVKLHERLQATTIFATADGAQAMSMADTLILIDADGVQAIGTPRELYEQPENMAIAKLLGDPPINLIRGELKRDRGALQFCEAGEGTIEINVSMVAHAKTAQLFAGKSVVAGIRPEDIALASSAAARDKNSIANFRAIAEQIEPFGSHTEVHFSTGAHRGRCRSAGLIDRSEAGRRIEFVINLEKVCLFDQSDEKRVV